MSKIYKYLYIVVLSLFMTISFKFVSVKADADTEEREKLIVCDATLNDDFLDNSVIIVLKNNISLQFNKYNCDDFNEINCTKVDDLTKYSVELLKNQIIAERTGDWSKIQKHKDTNMLIDANKFHRILCLTIDKSGKDNVLKAIRELEKRNDIYYAEPNYIESINATADDTYFSTRQWGLNDTYGINVTKAWNYTIGNPNILVGVIDSGIDGQHPDLINVINDDLHRDYVDTPIFSDVREVSKENLKDSDGHGTHVAGIIGAQGNNSIGISGVAQNIRLVSLRVMDETGHGSAENVKKAVDFATREAIPILNYSGGGKNNHVGRKESIENYPGLFVCAAGNDDQDNDVNEYYPGNYNFDNLITVGAIQRNGKRPDVSDWGYTKEGEPQGSNYGKTKVDIFAP